MAVNSFNAQNPPVTTKGDVFTFSTIPTRLAVGSNNTVLTADSSTATGLKWAAASTGKVVQIVSATYSTQTISSSATYADTGLTATITPTSASNQIVVFVNQSGLYKDGSNTSVVVKLLRGSTDLIKFVERAGQLSSALATTPNGVGSGSAVYVDSPATTSATTYKTQFISRAGTSDAYVQVDSAVSSILLMEVTP